MKIFKIGMMTLVVVLCSVAVFHWSYTSPHSPIGWEELIIPLADKHTVVRFERKPAHYFLSEFHRRVRINQYGPSEVEETILIPPNTGTRTKIKIYFHEKNLTYYFQEEKSVHMVFLKDSCIRTTIKDPDLDIPFCQNRFFRKQEIDFTKLRYIGEVTDLGLSGSLMLKSANP